MNVKVYSTQTCPYCHRVKDYLKSKNIPYQDFDVGTDSAAREEMVKLSGQMGVPVVTIDGNLVIGFDKEKIDSFLGL
ncbi:MAG: glutaredoxin family protein [Candidatus Omnitrophica bacterium]|nr:glutaredoxin family protein [Candidatus Omnitrophota bacterium]MBU2044346.1 glutaredoxin family protein [Candidatus Omnitrophota bacterium]MBU2251419.1 glutaredoxin family protein [Candidatus Omnitrophota bacterium]MBU2265434.1 glutaredoxin family protein [Candidatus Omnitrophota bacterium]